MIFFYFFGGLCTIVWLWDLWKDQDPNWPRSEWDPNWPRGERASKKSKSKPKERFVCGTPYIMAQSYQSPQLVQPPQPPHQVSVPAPDTLAELASKIHIEFVGGPFDGAHCFDYVDQDVATYQGEIVWVTGYKKSYYNFDGQNYFWTKRKEGWEQTGYGQPGWELEGEDWKEA